MKHPGVERAQSITGFSAMQLDILLDRKEAQKSFHGHPWGLKSMAKNIEMD
jgi:hypothetical protein